MEEILLVGSGGMALDYAKVLKEFNINIIVIGRGEKSAITFLEETGISVIKGGLKSYLKSNPKLPSSAIVAVGVEGLKDAAIALMVAGVKNILVEKPGALNLAELVEMEVYQKKYECKVYVAYNRRFYASVQKAKQLISEDGGVKSFNFEFTEWAHTIEPLIKAEGVKEKWLLANSSHVIDLAFFLGGSPASMTYLHSGGLSWHPSSSVFAGCGQSKGGALFTYQANWDAPGRWSLEFLTKNFRFIFKPMEKLEVIRKGTVTVESLAIEDHLDKQFKPGLYNQFRAFITGSNELCTLSEQVNFTSSYYYPMAGYKD